MTLSFFNRADSSFLSRLFGCDMDSNAWYVPSIIEAANDDDPWFDDLAFVWLMGATKRKA